MMTQKTEDIPAPVEAGNEAGLKELDKINEQEQDDDEDEESESDDEDEDEEDDQDEP